MQEDLKFVNRDYDRSLNSDFIINVSPKMGEYEEALPIKDPNGLTLGWQIKPMYE